MGSVYFGEEHDAFRKTVRDFMEKEVAPKADDWERDRRIPREIFRRMGDLGFLGIIYPESYGGSGADLFFAVAFLEELARSRMGGFCAAVSVQQFMATRHIFQNGSEALKRRYLKGSIEGRLVGALAITEPDAGSDVANLRTTAVREGGFFRLNGSKTFITNGGSGDFITVAARTGGPGDAGISLLVVDADLPGVHVARKLDKMGWHASDTAELVFEEALVPAENLVGEENTGFYQIMEAFPLERLCAAAIGVGGGRLALDLTWRYLAERTAFGKPLHRYQALTHPLAGLEAELEAARQLAYHAAWLMEQGENALMASVQAKLFATELGKRIADQCLQCFGGFGFMEEYPLARFYRDARAGTIAGGTSEIMREIIARLFVAEASEGRGNPEKREPRPRSSPPPPPAKATSVVPPLPQDPPPSPGEPTVEAVARAFPARFRPEHAEGWKAVFHYKLKGAAKPEWTVAIEDGRCTMEEGLRGEATCVVEMKEATFLGIQTGKANPQTAFMMGKVKVSSLSEMMKFLKAFG